MKKLFFVLSIVAAMWLDCTGQATDAQLTTQANVIRNETSPGGNTKTRIADMFQALINSKQSIIGIVNTAGAANAYTISVTSAVTTYNKQWFLVKFHVGNTGATTINVNTLGPKTIKKNVIEDLEEGDIIAGGIYIIGYDGTFFQQIGGSGGGGGDAVASVTGNIVDNSDPLNPVVTGIASVTGDGVDNTDPANPVMSFSSLTASNGITRTGNNFALGGTMTGNVSINSNVANTNTFTIGGTTRPNRIQFLAGNVGTNSGTITVDDTSTSLSRTVGNPMSIVLSSLGMTVTDLLGNKGLVYAADYSTNFAADPRGIPDVGWVTTQAANAWPLTGTRSFTGNATIAGGGFNATIGQSGDRMGNFRVWSNGTVGLDGSTNAFLQTGSSTVTTSATAVTIATGTAGFEVVAPTVEMTVDTDYRYYNTSNNNFLTWGGAGTLVNLDEIDGGGSFAVNDSDSPLFVVGALGDITFFSIPEFNSAPTITNDLQLIPKSYADTKAPLYMTAVTYTANRVATTADVGKVVYMNVGSANTFTINSGVFEVGTFLNVRVLDEATTAVEGASVTINPQSGSLVLNSAGINVFYQSSADVWELYNGSTFSYTDVTLGAPVTITTTGQSWTFTGGDFIATDGTRKFQVDAGSGVELDLGSDATGDIYYRDASGHVTRLPVGSNGNVLTLASGLPSWSAAGGVSDGDKTDISVTGGGATWTIDAGVVTYAKMQNAAGGTRIIGRSASSAGGLNEIVFTADGQVLRRTGGALGPGAMDLADADAVGTSILGVANGGTGLATDIRAANNTWTGTNTFSNQVNFGDVTTPTKQMHFDLSGITAANNRTITIPDASGGMMVSLFNQATLNFDLTAVDEQDLTITVTGAVDGDRVIMGTPNAAMVAGVAYHAWVSAADTVSIRAFCHGVACAANPGSGTFKVSVVKQ